MIQLITDRNNEKKLKVNNRFNSLIIEKNTSVFKN